MNSKPPLAFYGLITSALMTQPYASRVNTMAGVTTVTPLLQLAFLLLATCHCCFAIGDGLLRNGNFEHGPSAKDMKGTQVTGKYAIPQWEISGFVEYIRSGQKQGDMLLVVPEGAFAVRLGNEASIKQRLKVMKGMYYSITFSAARTCAQEERLNISVAPDSGVLPMQTMYSSNGWDSYAWAFRAELSYADIVIHNPGVEEDPACGPLIDAVAIRALYPPRPTNREHTEKRRMGRRSIHLTKHIMGSTNPTTHPRQELTSPWMDCRIPQGSQIH
ncbi:Protein DUF642 L-GALACTONO-1,4-LACTONE-RESPONSIVE GENE 2 [Linum perenne]